MGDTHEIPGKAVVHYHADHPKQTIERNVAAEYRRDDYRPGRLKREKDGTAAWGGWFAAYRGSSFDLECKTDIHLRGTTSQGDAYDIAVDHYKYNPKNKQIEFYSEGKKVGHTSVNEWADADLDYARELRPGVAGKLMDWANRLAERAARRAGVSEANIEREMRYVHAPREEQDAYDRRMNRTAIIQQMRADPESQLTHDTRGFDVARDTMTYNPYSDHDINVVVDEAAARAHAKPRPAPPVPDATKPEPHKPMLPADLVEQVRRQVATPEPALPRDFDPSKLDGVRWHTTSGAHAATYYTAIVDGTERTIWQEDFARHRDGAHPRGRVTEYMLPFLRETGQMPQPDSGIQLKSFIAKGPDARGMSERSFV